MNLQYYPTGERTAALMWAKFKRPIGHVCDPSAGKGHLFQHAKAGFPSLSEDEIPWLAEVPDETVQGRRLSYRVRDYARRKFECIPEISAIEIDAQHHANLREVGAKILGHDFMEISSLASVQQVVMNPPFAQGVAHVLHAWDCVYDAEIVAIINAESIRNPFSAERQRLVHLIERHGSVEFLQDQFVDEVERETDVEVALIYLEKVPAHYLDVDSMLSGLKRGDNQMGDLDVQESAALALPSNFIQDTYTRFLLAVEAARKHSEAEALYQHLSNNLGLTLAEMQAKGVGNDARENVGSVREAAGKTFKTRYEEIKKRAWSQIIRSALLNDMLSNQARRKLESTVSTIYELEFTVANVRGFLLGVVQAQPEIYRDMIVQMFDTIIERSSDNVTFYKSWKSNQKHRIGVRIRRSRFIIPRFEMSYSGSISYESERFLADIDKVWGYLMEGRRDSYDGLVEAFRRQNPRAGERVSTRYFDFRFYKHAGTIHFYPKSDEVVEKINLFVGKLRNWLPGDMEEANADFSKQYDKGETMTKAYMGEYSKLTRTRYGLDRPAIQLLREINGNEVTDDSLNRLDQAINKVHDDLGLKCGPALEGSRKILAIESSIPAGEPHQLQLLAA